MYEEETRADTIKTTQMVSTCEIQILRNIQEAALFDRMHIKEYKSYLPNSERREICQTEVTYM